MGDGRGPVAVALLALAGTCVAALLIGTPPRSLRGEPAAQSFLAIWRQSRLATFVVDSDFTRTLPSGNRLIQQVRTVQRPPADRLVIGFGSASGRLGGKILRCVSAPDGTSQCFTATDAPDYAAEVEGEIAGLERYVRGERPLYLVTAFADGGAQNARAHCFRLDLAIDLPSPPYGAHALFCFDRTSLAPSLTVVERPEATDRTEATSISMTVSDADLDAITNRGSVVGLPGPTTTTLTTTTVATTTSSSN
ncbi:MAG: hypothetical protein QOC92_2338 [Acidimicrobiaceae bacterium]